MNTVIVWLLFFGQGVNAGVRLLDKEFATEKDCKAVAASLERQAADKTAFPYVKTICVEARIRS